MKRVNFLKSLAKGLGLTMVIPFITLPKPPKPKPPNPKVLKTGTYIIQEGITNEGYKAPNFVNDIIVTDNKIYKRTFNGHE